MQNLNIVEFKNASSTEIIAYRLGQRNGNKSGRMRKDSRGGDRESDTGDEREEVETGRVRRRRPPIWCPRAPILTS